METANTAGQMPLDARDLLHPGDAFGHYRIVRLLGRGGMGEVYEVVHTTLDGRFALKLLQPGIMGVPGVVERFRREARAMHKLKHPHILHVDEFGETEGRVWLRMELADGWPFPDGTRAVSLQEAMRLEAGGISAGEGDETLLPGQLPASRSPGVPSALAREWLRQILEGLVHAHEFPGGAVVHRDVKPANLLFHEGRLKLADFGLVHLAGEEWLHSRLQSSLTMQALRGQPTGADGIPEETLQVGEEPGLGAAAIMGTFEYMPPEGKAGQAGADPRGDLFAVGKIAYQLLTGEREIGFKAPSRLVPGLDRAWDGWVERATEPRPGDRFQSAREMLAALPPAPGSEVDHAAPPGPAAKLPVEPAAEKARDPAEADVFWGRG
ncbi:MAG: serine/threonine-protein kinase, partial [Opitutales bacterium]